MFSSNCCAISDFEACEDSINGKQCKGPDVHHHEQAKSTQSSFQRLDESLVTVFFFYMRNPFKEASPVTIC